RLLRIRGDLRGNSLEPLVRLMEGADNGIEAVLACFLNLVIKSLNVRHLHYLSWPAWCGLLLRVRFIWDVMVHRTIDSAELLHCTTCRQGPTKAPTHQNQPPTVALAGPAFWGRTI